MISILIYFFFGPKKLGASRIGFLFGVTAPDVVIGDERALVLVEEGREDLFVVLVAKLGGGVTVFGGGVAIFGATLFGVISFGKGDDLVSSGVLARFSWK